MAKSTFTYVIQAKTITGEWVNRKGGSSTFPDGLQGRIDRLVAKSEGAVRAENFRIWDTKKEEVWIPEPIHVPSPEQVAEREARKAERDREYAIQREKDQAAAQVAYDEYLRLAAIARESVSGKTVASVEDFNSLPDGEKDILWGDLSTAYSSTDIDGYGDEGAGYDITKFAENLLKLGWVYNPPKV